MSLAKRLFIAFLLVVAVTLACRVVLPRYGLDVPVAIMVLGYIVILVACLIAAEPDEDEEDENGPDGEHAGGPSSDPHTGVLARFEDRRG